jgi:hypothetical protein
MKPGRIVALIIGLLLLLPGLGLLLSGGGLAVAYAVARDDEGYVSADLDRVQSSSVAVTAEEADFGVDGTGPDWLFDALDVDLRVRVVPVNGQASFVGIARAGAVDAYLAGTAYDEVADVSDGSLTYRHREGDAEIAKPVDQQFWTRSATGTGSIRIDWRAQPGRWSAVVMNADGTPGVSADVEVGTKAGFVFPLAFSMIGAGLLVVAAGLVLVVIGINGRPPQEPAAPDGVPVAVGEAPPATRATPVSLQATLDPNLSRWMWLVKWFLAIPHIFVLAFLWAAFLVLTVVAWFAIVFTGRYPRAIFDFNVGVLRWTWRVSYYATNGGLGTDRYPHFSLSPQESDHARLDIAYPARVSRGLVWVKSWLLAVPHYLIVGLLLGSTTVAWSTTNDDWVRISTGGLTSLLVFFAAVALLFTGRYPQPLFDLVIGLNRWVYRVIAYAALMTDQYPPFRLDQGGNEPQSRPPAGPAPAVPGARTEQVPQRGSPMT